MDEQNLINITQQQNYPTVSKSTQNASNNNNNLNMQIMKEMRTKILNNYYDSIK